MFGIFGVISNSSERSVEALLNRRLPSIDRPGSYEKSFTRYAGNRGGVAFAHERLTDAAISSRAKQPMEHRESGTVITYNGEIYNYLEVRTELENIGHSFESDSDTEVLLKAWVQWGLDALSRLNGVFAFALHCKKTGDVWLVRDRFGVKPLLWARLADRSVIFSSSVASVAAYVGAEIDVDYCARGVRYKVFETMESGSPFSNVNSVPAGGWVKFELTNEKVIEKTGQWYDLVRAVAEKKHVIKDWSSKELLTECRVLLEAAVSVRLRGDLPIAVSLSGGLDSSSIAALTIQEITDLNGFTYGSPDAEKSEGPMVAALAERLNINVNYVWPHRNDLETLLEQTLIFQEAPFVGVGVLAQNAVFCAVRDQGYKVLMGGQGGDESFAGYRKFFILALKAALNTKDPISIIQAIYSMGRMLIAETNQLALYWNNLRRYRNDEPKTFELLDWVPKPLNLWGNGGCDLTDRQIQDIQQFSIPSLLRYEDRNSMGHGVETRLPFMDSQLVEFALALPDRLKIMNGYGKWALRDITRGLVPDFIRLNRKKRGFDVTQAWVKEGIGKSLRSRILDQRSALKPYLKARIDYAALLSDVNLARDRNLLDEALMLVWLIEPVRMPSAEGHGQ